MKLSVAMCLTTFITRSFLNSHATMKAGGETEGGDHREDKSRNTGREWLLRKFPLPVRHGVPHNISEEAPLSLFQSLTGASYHLGRHDAQ